MINTYQASATTMPDIFISYASADRERARQLADLLTRRGYSVWWDRTIPPGRVFDEVIQEAIQAARCMIVLWSAESVRSNWVKTEAAEGAARNILVPALIGEATPPIEFKRIQAANLTRWEGDEEQSEYRNLIDAVERLMAQAPRATAAPASLVQAHRPAAVAPPRMGTFKTFGLGAVVALAAVGAFWLYGKMSREPTTPPLASVPAPKPKTGDLPSVADAPSPTTGATAAPASAAPRGRVNLLAAEHGGQVLAASTDRWRDLIDGKEETYAWGDNKGFGVYGFRDGKSALIDTFTVLVPSQSGYNIKDFELFVGNTTPTGPFESIGRFSTQNVRLMQNPFQEFKFAPVKAKYFKLQSLRNHEGAESPTMLYEIQLFGELQ